MNRLTIGRSKLILESWRSCIEGLRNVQWRDWCWVYTFYIYTVLMFHGPSIVCSIYKYLHLFRTVTPDLINDSAVYERIEFKAGLVTYSLRRVEG